MAFGDTHFQLESTYLNLPFKYLCCAGLGARTPQVRVNVRELRASADPI